MGCHALLQGIFLTQWLNTSLLWLLHGRQILYCGASKKVLVWMWELDHKEDLMTKNWCLWSVVLEKPLESHLDSKEIKPVNPKGNQPWIFTGRTYAEAPITLAIWCKDPDAGKDGRQKEKGVAEDEMIRQQHQLSRHELEQTPGDSEGRGSLACCSPWDCKELDTTYQLNNSNNMHMYNWFILLYSGN